ncbi:CCHC-type zinc finger nucleic acid binding protein-like [Gordionus sp. m RMFG-2023]|uniref:CCHC-type zinc finger nucleic acid binding protein-like n=1 Tax=Gordionus sp. m RMFG-2023 TaxID=3053472 RepID=UPI0031FC5EDA
MRTNFNFRGREKLSCYNCGKPGHVVRDCQETKCFGWRKYGHIAPYCPRKRDKLRCASCGRFGHNREECNVSNINTRGYFPQRDMGQIVPNVRIIENREEKEIGIQDFTENKDPTIICFRCRKEGHVARECEYL